MRACPGIPIWGWTRSHFSPGIRNVSVRLFLLCLLLVPPLTHAGILIESVNGDGEKGKISIDGIRGRIDSGDLGGYMLVNLDTAQIYAVSHADRVVMELTPDKPSDKVHPGLKPAKPPQVKLSDAGKGPDILGYPTRRYRVSVNGLHCFDEYLAASLLKNADLKRFVEVMATASQAQRNTAIGMPFDDNAPCESADELVDDYYPRYGIPMRTVDSNGLVSHEIKHVDLHADLKPGTFIVPPNYESVTRDEMARRMAQGAPATQDHDLSDEEIRKLRSQIESQMKRLQSHKKDKQEPEPSPPAGQ